jgi:hypothetical protein
MWVPILAALAGGLATSAGNKFFSGSKEKHKNVPTLTKEQLPLLQQLINAGMGPGAGGAFGEAADYYRGNLGNNPQDFNAFAAPELRRFHEDIIPGLGEQFAGMGAGGLSSSGFRNAAVGAGTDLSERLAQIRANLRNQSAAGLANIGQAGLGNFSADRMTQPGTEGAFGKIAETFGNAAAQYGTKKFEDWYNKPSGTQSTAGTTSPYGGPATYQRQPLPEFNPTLRQT